MADFTSGFWGIYITVLTIVSVLGCGWLLWSQSTVKIPVSKDGKAETTGHSWDEGLEELNNPMPRWWKWAGSVSNFSINTPSLVIFAFAWRSAEHETAIAIGRDAP